MRILDPILRAGEGRTLRRLEDLTAQVNAIEEDVAALTDEQLRAETAAFRGRLAAGETLEDLLPEAFAVVREAARRVLGMRHFDVQVMGGAALHLGNIAQMRTGEGKTLVATLPAYLNALPGHGVHVVTVNDYLAGRDAARMGAVHAFLGLTVGVVTAELTPAQRRAAYACDITYGTNNEFGFDYLRDNMATDPAELVQRGHHYAIIDEVDSILIDEARTPLVISGPAPQEVGWYHAFAALVADLVRGRDYDVDEKKRTVGILEPGVAAVEDALGAEQLYAAEHTALVGQLTQALRAKELYRRDRDYVVVDGQVLLVDEHTGRVMDGRRYSEGLHQALEAKEGVAVEPENQTLATITLQNYFRRYTKLAGMTGTAESEAAELHRTYGLGVVPIPPNRPNRRVDHPDVVYRTEDAKLAAVVADITARHAAGQPVLAGTASVASSEKLSALLTAAGIPHRVLNAKQHAREAHVIAEAGRSGAVTVATNMAGRGTDICLGGNAEELARDLLADDGGLDPENPEHADAWAQAWPVALEHAQAVVAHERERVHAAGGLYVLGTERHESRRIDNQLRGRAGRQGDPGASRFYLSLEDELMRRFAGGMLTRAMDTLGASDLPVESTLVNRSVASAQTSTESRNAEIRRDVLKYDDVLSAQREVIYAERRRVLTDLDTRTEVRAMIRAVIDGIVDALPGFVEDWDLAQVLEDVRALIPVRLTAADLAGQLSGAGRTSGRGELALALYGAAGAAFEDREAYLGTARMRRLERQVLLAVVDRRWREHLLTMDYLREGIHMRALAQRDPLVEYQREAHEQFLAMLAAIKQESVGYLFGLELPALPDPQAGKEHPAPADDGGELAAPAGTGPGLDPA